MTPERWRQVTELFQAALDRPAAERLAFVDAASTLDPEVRAEVRAMLAAHDAAGAVDVPHVAMAADDPEPTPGGAIGPYEVRGLIGAGGMGRVYRARDARLDREVAVKVLPTSFAADAGRLRRFEQEARASGALTHPNVVTVHDVGTDHGRPYLVTELLDGETLRHRLARGALSVTRACELAAALARGLAAAHAKGVVHRDLKPENVIITRDGRVKILDFGVAKLRGAEGHRVAETAAPTVQTDAGVIVGTAGYMAPEQVRGEESDGRADVFALGAILFELLTGRRAFDRQSRSETLEATLLDDPLTSVRSAHNAPAAVLRIVERCLEKEPDARFQSAADLAFALETVGGNAATASREPTIARRAVWPILIAAALLLAVGAGVVKLWQTPETAPADSQLVRFPIPVDSRIRFTSHAAISPDGGTIVYSSSEGLEKSQRLFARRIDQIAAIALPGTEQAGRPFFSPDGESVAFWADNKLKRTRVDGTSAPVIICALESFLGGTWTADGTIVFGSTGKGLRRVDANGGMPQPVGAFAPAEADGLYHAPAMLPGGRTLLFTVYERERKFRIDALRLDTGERRTIVADGFDARYIPTGHIVYALGTALFALPFDPGRLEPLGPPVQLQDGVATAGRYGSAHYGLSDSGTLVFLPVVAEPRRMIAWVDERGTSTLLPLEPRAYLAPKLSPDGRQFAVVVEEADTFQIWIHDFDRGTFRRLTSGNRNWSPVWSPDGSRLFYVSERNDQYHLVRETLDSGSAPEVLLTSSDELGPGAVTPDGRLLFYATRSRRAAELRVLDLEQRQSTQVAALPHHAAMPVLSPDGRWLGFTGWVSGPPSIFVRRVGAQAPVRTLVEGAGYTVWNRQGDKLYFRSRRGGVQGSAEDGVFELPFDPVRGVAAGPERQLFRKSFEDWLGVPGFDVAADGRFLLVLTDGEALPREPHVVLHVDHELRRRARAAVR